MTQNLPSHNDFKFGIENLLKGVIEVIKLSYKLIDVTFYMARYPKKSMAYIFMFGSDIDLQLVQFR